ncbi:hypothetical protein TSUD_189210 [Trifolium subterraneum]|uniref:Aminotransferase-like plant mobile domain-containing protein n=1 Tax=Trifolium subterraneum TaxID=3900 RepID=A0A2Z6LVS0_TRISU|nr:hypothetical protein TSUD_189210 [Trifolium subterraneum]
MRIKNTMTNINKLIAYNNTDKLSTAQKDRLLQTPFKWVVDMKDNIKVSGILLDEMLSRWDSVTHGFRVGGKTVAFTPVDVCFALGLQTVGITVPLQDKSDCHVKSLFNGKDITVDSMLEKLKDLNREEDVEDFCKVYILFALFALYFPRKSTNVCNVPFSLLDDLNMLDTYNWGQAVYDFLVDSITKAATTYAQGGAAGQEITLSGCSAVLQIWVLEHLQLCGVSTKCFPRINKWTTLTTLTQVENIFLNAKAVLPQQRILFAQNEELRERIFRLEEGLKLLREEGGSGKIQEDKKRCQQLVNRLFETCTSEDKMDFLFVKVHGALMRGHLFACMKARKWISSLLMSAATKIMMGDLLKNRDEMKRFIITHAFADDVIKELPHLHHKPSHPCISKRSFTKIVSTHLGLDDDPFEIMRHCNLVSVHSHLII